MFGAVFIFFGATMLIGIATRFQTSVRVAAIIGGLVAFSVEFVYYVLSDRGLVRLFCPARRALKRLNWPYTRDGLRDFNCELAKLKAIEDRLIVGIDVEEYQRIYDSLMRRRGYRLEEISQIAYKLELAKKAWERKRSRLLVSDVLGEMTAQGCLKEDKK